MKPKICDVLRDLVPYIQFKNREKQPWRSVTFSKGVLNSVNDSPLIAYQTFSQTEFIIGKSDFTLSMYFHLIKRWFPFNFA